MKLTKSQKTKSTIRFDAVLSQSKSVKKTGSRTILTLPKNASTNISSQNMMIEGIVGSIPFQANVESNGKGVYFFEINKSIYDTINADTRDAVSVEITRIGEEAETRVPADFRKALSVFPKAQALWEAITPIARRDWIFWMISAKQLKTRSIRIEKACDMLSHGKKRVCCFGGIAWLMKSHVKSNKKYK